MFVGDSFNMAGLRKVDPLFAEIMVGTYLAIASLLCLNLYIALLSQTFTDAYGQAEATALLQQAQVIISVERNLSQNKKTKFGHYIQKECAPLVSIHRYMVFGNVFLCLLCMFSFLTLYHRGRDGDQNAPVCRFLGLVYKQQKPCTVVDILYHESNRMGIIQDIVLSIYVDLYGFQEPSSGQHQ